MRHNPKTYKVSDIFVEGIISGENANPNPGGGTTGGGNTNSNVSGMMSFPGRGPYDVVFWDADRFENTPISTYFHIPILSGNSIRIMGRFAAGAIGVSTGTDVAEYNLGISLWNNNHQSITSMNYSLTVQEEVSYLVDVRVDWRIDSFVSVGSFVDLKVIYTPEVVSYTGFAPGIFVPFFCCIDSHVALNATNPATVTETNATNFVGVG